MINEKIEKAFNEQIRHELDSAYLYLSMSAFFDSQGWEGMAKWMRKQAGEEQAHAMRFYDHINEREGRVHFAALAQPKSEWSSILDAWKDAYKHEQFISSKIRELAKLATDENDYTARPMLDWFLTEQIEEEQQTVKVVGLIEKIGPTGGALVMLDRELGERKD